jgi:hypothetical protein
MDFPIRNRQPGCQGWLNWLNVYFPNQLFIKHVAKSAHRSIYEAAHLHLPEIRTCSVCAAYGYGNGSYTRD